MKDCNIAAEVLNSKQSNEERKRVLDDLSGRKKKKVQEKTLGELVKGAGKSSTGVEVGNKLPKTRLLYVTPELLATDSFQQVLRDLHSRW